KFRLSHIVRATGKEQQASRGGYRGGEAGQLAIPPQRRLDVAARLRGGRRVGDDDVETFSGSGGPGRFAQGLTPLQCASAPPPPWRRSAGGGKQPPGRDRPPPNSEPPRWRPPATTTPPVKQ